MPLSGWFRSSYLSSPDFSHPGSQHIANSLRELEMCTVRVSGLHIYETPLQQGPLQKLGIVTHDFLVVEVSAVVHPTRGDLRTGLKIRAEKTGRDQSGMNTGIHVKEIHFVSEDNITRKLFVDTHDVSVPMDQLLRVLTEHSADYDLLNDNCWLYADNTLRALVQKFGELHPESGDAMNESLRQLACPIMPGRLARAGAMATMAIVATFGATVFLYKTLSSFAQSDVEAEGEENEE